MWGFNASVWIKLEDMSMSRVICSYGCVVRIYRDFDTFVNGLVN